MVRHGLPTVTLPENYSCSLGTELYCVIIQIMHLFDVIGDDLQFFRSKLVHAFLQQGYHGHQ